MNVSFIVIITSLLLLSPSLIAAFSLETDATSSLGDIVESYSQETMSGKRFNVQGWVYVQIQGAPYERGYQYGYLLAEEIIDLMTRWSNMIHNHPSFKPFSRFMDQQQYESVSAKWWEFCKKTAVRMYWDEYPQEYKDEIQGIAAGITQRGLFLYGEPVTYRDVLASNSMYEMLSKLTDRKIRKGIHPLFTLYDMIKPDIEGYASLSKEEFVESSLQDPFSPVHHHCSSFIATGDATTDGQLIISNSMWSSIDGAGMWWWSYYIAIRWNILLDVIPTEGYRFQMSCAPGYIWSDHDFYQNNAGMVFIETTLPQGIWTEEGLPLAIRARKAVQYADSIDDVIHFLRTDNDGVMNAVWLIGDTKNGEIARYELGLYHDAVIERTKNGFQWSSNNPMDFWVRWEKMDWKLFIQQYIYHIILGLNNYQYHSPWYLPASRDLAFEELGNKHYGKIDVEVVKQIMSTDPIGTYSPDCKITSTSLVANNGVWLFTGNPGGKNLSMAVFDAPSVYYTEVLPVGWVRIYGLPTDHDYISSEADPVQGDPPMVQWKTSIGQKRNDLFSQSINVDSVIYSTSNDGILTAIDSSTGTILWNMTIGPLPTRPVYVNHSLYIGTYEGLKKVDVEWLQVGIKPIGPIICPPTYGSKTLFVGSQSGLLFSYNVSNGVERWRLNLDSEVWISEPTKDIIVAAAGPILHGINVTNAEILWIRETDAVITMQPVIIDDVVYVGSWDSYLYAFNCTTGQNIWKFQTGWGVESTPVADEATLYFGSYDGVVYAIDKNSSDIRWSFKSNGAITSSPVLFNEQIIIGSHDGYLYGLDAKNGRIQWSFAPGRVINDQRENYFTTAFRSNTIAEDEKVFFGATGDYYCLQI
ncbi:MAG: PQQ-binding-like beta-propeller repeat protein [Candidatus Thermoplasmatota archaeon]|nr:PQQ-binding-like beta-propeller repeat protein [Candidatus Thermoplasmatota archaeon]